MTYTRLPQTAPPGSLSRSPPSRARRRSAAVGDKLRQLRPEGLIALEVSRPAAFHERRPLNLPVEQQQLVRIVDQQGRKVVNVISLHRAASTIASPAAGTNPQDGDLQDLEDHTGDVWRTGHVPLPHGEL